MLCLFVPFCSTPSRSIEAFWGSAAWHAPSVTQLQAGYKRLEKAPVLLCSGNIMEYHENSWKFIAIPTEIHGISEWIAINPGVQASFLRMRMTPRHLQPHPLLPKPKSSRLSDALTSRRGCQRFARDIQWSLEKIWGAFEQRSKVPLTCLVLGLHKLHLVVRLSLGFVSSAKGLT